MNVDTQHNNARFGKSQAKALHKVIAHTCDQKFAGHGEEIFYTVSLEATDYGTLWVKVRKDIPSLPPTNMLRATHRSESWYCHVGKRGGIEVHMAPKHMTQFKGQYWCGMYVRKDLSTTGLF